MAAAILSWSRRTQDDKGRTWLTLAEARTSDPHLPGSTPIYLSVGPNRCELQHCEREVDRQNRRKAFHEQIRIGANRCRCRCQPPPQDRRASQLGRARAKVHVLVHVA